jgi:hypothetical protein
MNTQRLNQILPLLLASGLGACQLASTTETFVQSREAEMNQRRGGRDADVPASPPGVDTPTAPAAVPIPTAPGIELFPMNADEIRTAAATTQSFEVGKLGNVEYGQDISTIMARGAIIVNRGNGVAEYDFDHDGKADFAGSATLAMASGNLTELGGAPYFARQIVWRSNSVNEITTTWERPGKPVLRVSKNYLGLLVSDAHTKGEGDLIRSIQYSADEHTHTFCVVRDIDQRIAVTEASFAEHLGLFTPSVFGSKF